jgi:hypothetical protein
MGWTEAQREASRTEGFGGGALNLIKFAAIILVADLVWFAYEVRLLCTLCTLRRVRSSAVHVACPRDGAWQLCGCCPLLTGHLPAVPSVPPAAGGDRLGCAHQPLQVNGPECSQPGSHYTF